MLSFSEFHKALKVVHPFIPQTSLKGALQGIEYNPEEGVLAAVGFASGIYYMLPERIADTPLFLPESFISSVEKVPPNTEWSGIKRTGSEESYKVSFGSLSLKFASLNCERRKMQEFTGESCEVQPEFIVQLDKLAAFMCQDDRKVNLHGLYCGDDRIYSCDNIRIVSFSAPVPDLMKGVFLPYACVEGIRKKQDIRFFQLHGNLLVFGTDSSIFYFTSVAAQFPDVKRIVEESEQPPFSAIVIDRSSQEFAAFSSMFGAGTDRSVLTISVEDNRLVLETATFLADMNLRCSLGLASSEVVVEKFHINSRVFLDGLGLSSNLKVGSRSVLFHDEFSSYMAMKMVK